MTPRGSMAGSKQIGLRKSATAIALQKWGTQTQKHQLLPVFEVCSCSSSFYWKIQKGSSPPPKKKNGLFQWVFRRTQKGPRPPPRQTKKTWTDPLRAKVWDATGLRSCWRAGCLACLPAWTMRVEKINGKQWKPITGKKSVIPLARSRAPSARTLGAHCPAPPPCRTSPAWPPSPRSLPRTRGCIC